ncbi:response regulator containing a CheY-like receiver domain and an HTH DNA-binding domain [Xenococcus sp. PCC 7305]|nr:response regulator containing a CheY-like receiver domain and an HTH DNA-binding domain [Xenococcus sp. PCC 7305]
MNSLNGDYTKTTSVDNPSSTIKVFIVDDQKMIREGLKALIKTEPDLEVIGTASNGEDSIKQVETLQPDIILMDMEMPGMDGVTATRMICDKFPQIKILVLSTFDTQEYVARSLSSGAMGYLLKGTPAKELTNAIRSVHLGYAQIGPGIYQNLPLIPKGSAAAAAQKIPATAHPEPPTQSQDSSSALSPRFKGQLATTSDSEAALAIERKKSSIANRKFEQTVLLRPSPKWSRATIWAVAGVTIFVVSWSAIAKIEQVVPAIGQLKPEGSVKEVQVPTNGVVQEVLVDEGQRVQKGDILLVLDSTTTKAQLDSLKNIKKSLEQENRFYRAIMTGKIAPNQIDRTVAQLEIPREVAYLARNRSQLAAEIDLYRAQLGADTGNLSVEQQARLRNARAEKNSRTATARLEVEQLQKQLEQNQIQLADAREQLITSRQVLAEIKERNEEAAQKAKESLAIEEKTLSSIKPLVEEGAIAELQLDRQQREVNDIQATMIEQGARGTIEYNNQRQEVTTTQAEIQRLLEEEKRLRLDIAQAREQLINTTSSSDKDILDQIANNQQRIADIDTQLNRSIVDNSKRLNENNAQMSNYEQNLKYQTIPAPVSGVILDLQAYPGYVPQAGQGSQAILKIVPDDKLVAEIFIKPEDIGFVKMDMTTDVRISAFPFGEFGDVKGKVTYIGGSSIDPDPQPPFNFVRFPAEVELEQQHIEIKGEDKKLQSGMSVQANIRIKEDRTVLSLFASKFITGLDKFKESR